MGYPGVHAAGRPHRPAVIMANSGEALSYRDLDERSNRLAHVFRDQGLQRGDHVALLMENQIRYMEVIWAALRSGLFITAINSFLSAPEVEHIIDDCDARIVISSRAKGDVGGTINPAMTPKVERWLMSDGLVGGDGAPDWESYEDVTADARPTAIADECAGLTMLYSSGTTGRPKGVKRPLPEHAIDELDPRTADFLIPFYDYGPDMIYLSLAPMYHAAPLAFSSTVHRVGGNEERSSSPGVANTSTTRPPTRRLTRVCLVGARRSATLAIWTRRVISSSRTARRT